MAEDRDRRRVRPKNVGGAPLPMVHEDKRVEEWDEWADRSYGRAVFYLEKARRCYFDARLKHYGISSMHMLVLSYLWEGHDGDTQSVIAEVIGVDPATVTRCAQKLEALGYIARSVSGRDPRARFLSLTDAGWSLADPIRVISSSWTDQVTAHLSPRRQAEILHALQRITVAAQDACAVGVPERDLEGREGR